MSAILFVRVKSDLPFEELELRVNKRRPEFKKVPGLIQKFYGLDKSTGDVCGIYFFEDQKALAAFGNSELAKTIPSAYEVIEVRKEIYDVLFPLYSDRGPVKE